MGWSSGTYVMGDIIAATKKIVTDIKTREVLYTKFISAFEDADWDCQTECLGNDPAFDKALYKLHPTWKEE